MAHKRHLAILSRDIQVTTRRVSRSNGRDEKCTQKRGLESPWKAPNRRPRSRWDDNIRLPYRKIGCKSGEVNESAWGSCPMVGFGFG